MKKRVALIVGPIIGVLIFTYCLNPFNTPSWSPIARLTGFMPFYNPTVSMEPTLRRGSTIVASAWPYLLGEPRPGDVVVFRFPPDPSILYAKRIIADGGSKVSVSRCLATVDDSSLSEPYANSEGDDIAHLCTFEPVLVPDDQYFVLSDNRTNGFDSRSWGFVPKANVIARVMVE